MGLNHSEDPNAVMKPSFTLGDVYTGLHPDDVVGILSLYAPAGAGGSDSFTIFNDGGVELSVSSMALDTSGSWISWSPQAPFTVPAGGLRSVTVSIDFGSAPNWQSTRRLLVFSDDPDESPYPGGVFINVDKAEETCFALTRTRTGQGSVPTATPSSSTGCGSGSYHAGERITVNASPASGWSVGSWTGTDNDGSTSTSNTLTMPARSHTVTVYYVEDAPSCHALNRTHTATATMPDGGHAARASPSPETAPSPRSGPSLPTASSPGTAPGGAGACRSGACGHTVSYP